MKITIKNWMEAASDILFHWGHFGLEAQRELRAIRKGLLAACSLLLAILMRIIFIFTLPISSIVVAVAQKKSEEAYIKQAERLHRGYTVFGDEHEHG